MSSRWDPLSAPPEQGSRVHDPELDAPPRRTVRLRDPDVHIHQRLLTNPFLALLMFIPWCAGFRWACSTRNFYLVNALVVAFPGVLWLLQYHCLDCGATGSLFRWRRHACEHVRARQLVGRERRFRGPNPTTQAVLWGYAVAIATILVLIALRPQW
jgi:hypothetical protein